MRATSFALALALGLAAPRLSGAESRPRYGQTVDAALLGTPLAVDPITAQAHADVTLVGLVFDTLYRISADGTVQPHLAFGPPVYDPVRGQAHVSVRRGVLFHDGSELTPTDVAESLERVRTRVAWLLAPVTAIRATEDGVDLVLRTQVAELSALLALPATAITKRGQSPSTTRPIGSGPFAVDIIDFAGKKLALRAFDSHFAGRPYLDRLALSWFDTSDGEVRRFETGAAQLSSRGAAAFAGAKPKYPAEDVESPPAVLLYVGFGRKNPALTREPAFRQAFDLALDRGAIATITTGEHTWPTRRPLPAAAGGVLLSPAESAGDASAARAMLAEAGRRTPALSPEVLRAIKLSIVIEQTRPDDRDIALRVGRALDKLGIGFAIEPVAPEVARDRIARGDCDLWIGQLALPVNLASAWWGAAFALGGEGWAQTQLARGAVSATGAAQQFASRLPIVPLMFRSLVIWHRSDVRGLSFDALGRPSLADLYWFP